MTPLTEGPHNGAFILSEANGKRSRENVVVMGGLKAGTVLGGAGVSASDVHNAINAGGTAYGVLINATPAGDPVPAAVIVRDAEVNGNAIDYRQFHDDDPLDDAAKAPIHAALADVGIRVRL